MTMRQRATLAFLLGAALAACGDSSGPDGEIRQPGDLTILRMAEGMPALTTYDTTFTAVRGQDSELRIDYVDGEEFLRFRLDDQTLLSDADGNELPTGGTVEIRVRVVNPELLELEFQPAGLRFNPLEPAELRVRYGRADDDFDDDGDVDEDDDRAEQQLSLWRQEQPGEPWVRIGSVVVKDLEEVRGGIFGFTRYSIAF